MKLFDSHCHLNDKAYQNDMAEVMARAAASGVSRAMIVGMTEKTSRQAIDIARRFPGCFASVGVHPHDASSCSEKVISVLIKLAREPEVKAWGETGLDFNRMFSPADIQEKWFIRQLNAADELDLPLIFHERDSGGRFLQILKSRYAGAGRAGVVHCFSGSRRELEAYLELGFHIGITGIITIAGRGAALRKLAPHVPADRLLVETDAPYLTPAPERNHTRRNEPGFVRSVLMGLAEARNDPPEALAKTTWDNAAGLFRIR